MLHISVTHGELKQCCPSGRLFPLYPPGMLSSRGQCGLEAKFFGLGLGLVVSGLGLVLGLTGFGLGLTEVGLVAS